MDLKTTRRRTIWELTRDAANFDYHGQVAWYHDGAVKAGLIDGHHLPAAIFVHAPEGSTFVDVAVMRMAPDPGTGECETLEQGRRLCEDLIAKYDGCQITNNWPGMAPDPIFWQLPAYKMEG